MSDPKDKALRKPTVAAAAKGGAAGKAEGPSEGQPEKKKSWLGWAVGWVLVPATMLGIIFGGGVLVGVHLHDSWLARLVVWVAELFS